MTSTTSRPPRNRTRATIAISAAVLAVLIIVFFIFSGLYADVLWFDQLGYLEVLTTQWAALAVMFTVGFLAMGVFTWLGIFIAFRARPVYAKLNSQLDRYQQVIEPLRRLAMYGIPILLGIFMGVSTATKWTTVLQYLNRTSFGQTDPQFGLDVSFYVYELPFYHGVLGYASAVLLVTAVASLATAYLYGGIRINGREVRVTRSARIQLATLATIYLAVQAISIWLDQYNTLADDTGLITGASYTDVNAIIPGRQILAGIAILVAVLFLLTAIIGRWRLPLIGTALLIVSSLVIGVVYPGIIQGLIVNPTPRSLEAPYIQRNIEATRAAYGVNNVVTANYNATTDVTAGQLRSDATTTANIRILDPALVTKTFAQLQVVRQYYKFAPHLDVDRYTIAGKKQDTVIAVRELNQAGQSSPGWFNDTLVYTHGYGVVAAYGNQRNADGSPTFLESGIPSKGSLGTFEPRIYFGESSPSYSIVGSQQNGKDIELDYPADGTTGTTTTDANNATTTYNGNGGPKLDSLLKRLVYAIKFQSQEVVLSSAVTDQSQVLYDRNPKTRVQKVAPYLTLDSDAYPAVVNGRVVWIVDGYTTTSSYPYSRVQQLSSTIADTYTPSPAYPVDNINYIRNSVKATVDAYTGAVTLYAWDATDPILQTWQKIFPGTLKAQSEMSTELLAHVRYPADLFKVQRSILQTYHVTDTNSFYSGDDAWSVPTDPTQQAPAPAQPPYYLTMQVPGTPAPAFTLYSTYIPKATTDSSRSVLTGYLAVDSDWGPNYGKLTLLTLPKQVTVPGPGQVQNTFNSDPTVSTQLNQLRIGGQTEVVSGNLLTVPVGGGLLYVQPVYVQSSSTSSTSYPLLRKVLVAFGDKIAFEDTLNRALDTLFAGDSGATAGDTNVTTTPSPTPSPSGSTGTGTGTGTGTTTANPALKQALADYMTALKQREAAYAANDLVAAANADKAMQDAINRAIAATN